MYFNRVCQPVTLNDLYIDMYSGFVFGILIALAGYGGPFSGLR